MSRSFWSYDFNYEKSVIVDGEVGVILNRDF